MSKARVNITMTEADFYFNPHSTVKPPHKNNKNNYYDDGRTITMQLRELTDGVEIYTAILENGRHEYFMLQIDGEDFAVMYPFNKSASDLPFVEVSGSAPLRTAKNIFEQACTHGSLILKHNQRSFGQLIPYVIPAPE